MRHSPPGGRAGFFDDVLVGAEQWAGFDQRTITRGIGFDTEPTHCRSGHVIHVIRAIQRVIDAEPGMDLVEQEQFGAALPIVAYDDLDEAMRDVEVVRVEHLERDDVTAEVVAVLVGPRLRRCPRSSAIFGPAGPFDAAQMLQPEKDRLDPQVLLAPDRRVLIQP